MTLNDTIESYLETKEMYNKLEKKLQKTREQLDSYLRREGKLSIKTDKYIIESKEITTHRISKNTVPKEIWERWCKESSYSILKISKIEGKVRKSL